MSTALRGWQLDETLLNTKIFFFNISAAAPCFCQTCLLVIDFFLS